MIFVENVFPHVARFVEDGLSVALVTLISVEGSSPRPVGAMIGVASDGRSVGMITGGCAEKAIVEEALQCLQRGENKIVRYGAGSPYLDVVLPCGSGIDLLIDVESAQDIVASVNNLHASRQPAFLFIDPEAGKASIAAEGSALGDQWRQIAQYDPEYRVCVFGEGANLVAFCKIARQAGYATLAFSPDKDALEYLSGADVPGRPIHRNSDFNAMGFDNFSAVVTLFHEHEWETPILTAALNSIAGYIGALGSRKTHQLRLDALSAGPATRQPPAMVRGPVGLDIGAANPNEIAISILAEITQHRRRR